MAALIIQKGWIWLLLLGAVVRIVDGVPSDWTCEDSWFNEGQDGFCDCGCSESVVDPDCEDGRLPELRCDGGAYTAPSGGLFECAKDECRPVCGMLNRLEGSGPEECGACLPGFAGSETNLNGKCYFTVLTSKMVRTNPYLSPTDPFSWLPDSPDGILAFGFGDFDRDGDSDMIYISYAGNLMFVANRDDDGMQILNGTMNPFDDFLPINVVSWLQISVVDLNGDGWLDIFLGLTYLRNNGVNGQGRLSFSNMDMTDNPLPFRGIEHATYSQYYYYDSHYDLSDLLEMDWPMAFVDWDSDGDFDVLLGTSLELYENVGTITSPRFQLAVTNPIKATWNDDVYGNVKFVSFIDMDNDGLMDLVVVNQMDELRVLWNDNNTKFDVKSGTLEPLEGLRTRSQVVPLPSDWISSSTFAMSEHGWHMESFSIVSFENTFTGIMPGLDGNPFKHINKTWSSGALGVLYDDNNLLDLVSHNTSHILLFKNVGSTTNPIYGADCHEIYEPSPPTFVEGNATYYYSESYSSSREEERISGVALFDWDFDGDLDLIVSWTETLTILENHGSRMAPNFDPSQEMTPSFWLGSDELASITVVPFQFPLINSTTTTILAVTHIYGYGVDFYGLEGDELNKLDTNEYPVITAIDYCFGQVLFASISDDENVAVCYDGGDSIYTFVLNVYTERFEWIPGTFSSFGTITLPRLENQGAIIGDVDGDGDLDVISMAIGQGWTFWKNTGRECGSNCLDRAYCAEAPDGIDINPMFIYGLKSLGQITPGEAVGQCWCGPNFEGEQCEKCSSGYYGEDCEKQCPTYSTTKFELAYPAFPVLSDCQCYPTFVSVPRTDGGFRCVCLAGYGFDEGAQRCLPCEPGYFSDSLTLESCIPCEVILGQHATTLNQRYGAKSQSECSCAVSFMMVNFSACQCDIGWGYSAQKGVCELCNYGFQSNTISLDMCEPCPRGETTFRKGGLCEPEDCPDGYERENTNFTCIPCPLNYYRDSNGGEGGGGPKKCIPCPENFPVTLKNGTTSVDDCVAATGFFKFDDTNAISCESDEFTGKIICNDPGLSLHNLPLRPGYYRISNETTDIRECPYQRFCTPSPDSPSLENPYCRDFHTGVFCSTCVEGYAIGSFGCELCTPATIANAKNLASRWIFVLLFIAMIPMIYMCISVRRNTPSQSSSHTTSRTRTPTKIIESRLASKSIRQGVEMGKRVRETFGSKTKILIGFYQVMMQYVETVDLPTTKTHRTVKSIVDMDFSSLRDSFYVGCFVESNFCRAMFLHTMFPLFMIGFMFLATLYFRKFGSKRRMGVARGKFVQLSLQLFFVIYPGVSSSLLRSFMYTDFPKVDNDPEPTRVLKMDPSIQFNDSKSKLWRAYAGCMIIIYPIGIVLLFYACVRYHRKHHHHQQEQQQAQLIKAMAFLSRSYKDKFDWFECWELVRKLFQSTFFVLVHQVFPNNSKYIFTITGLFFLGIVNKLQPYKTTTNNILAEVFLALICFLGHFKLSRTHEGWYSRRQRCHVGSCINILCPCNACGI